MCLYEKQEMFFITIRMTTSCSLKLQQDPAVIKQIRADQNFDD